MIERKAWRYGNNIIGRDYLTGDTPFEHLVQEIYDSISGVTADKVNFLVEPERGKYIGNDPLLKTLRCRRPVWRLQLNPVLLDRFYNDRSGIRGQYYISPYNGQQRDLLLISRLTERLVNLADPSEDADLIRESLAKPSAKVWISEKALGGHKIIRASDLNLDEESIQNDWLDVARKVKRGGYNTAEHQFYCAALNGVRAPVPDQLEIKGAWITRSSKHEFVSLDKRDRNWQIFMFGFS